MMSWKRGITHRMTTLEILNSTPKERQLWYWRKEMESYHRYMIVYPKGDERRKHWYERYVSAIRTYNELSGMNLKPQEDECKLVKGTSITMP